MSTTPATGLKIFYCYAREDKAERDELDRHLSGLKRQYNLTTWSDIQITPGTEWEQEITTHLDSANLILLLISAHFIASEYCYGIEIWPDRDEAFSDITNGIAKALTDLLKPAKSTKEPKDIPNSSSKVERKPSTFGEWLAQGDRFFDAAEYEKALEAYEESLKIEPENFDALCSSGVVLFRLKRYEEALIVYEKALTINPISGSCWNGKAACLYCLQQYEQALETYNTTTYFDSKKSSSLFPS